MKGVNFDDANKVMSEINMDDVIDERYGPRDHNHILGVLNLRFSENRLRMQY